MYFIIEKAGNVLWHTVKKNTFHSSKDY